MDGGQRTAPDGFRDVRRASPGRGPLSLPNFRLQLSLPKLTVTLHAFTRIKVRGGCGHGPSKLHSWSSPSPLGDWLCAAVVMPESLEIFKSPPSRGF
jgi:hypothetical protein